MDNFEVICSKQIAEDLGLSWAQIQQCYNSSFQQIEEDQYGNDNDLLYYDQKKFMELGLTFLPDLFINNVKYEGSISEFDLIFSVCSCMHDKV